MFTGIVEEIGIVNRLWRVGQGYSLTVQAKTILDDVKLGDSIAINGICLTVTDFTTENFTVGLAPETRNRTNIVHLQQGQRVNLERALTPTTRMGGHFVQGHVDGMGTITRFRPDADALWVTIQAEASLMRYIVPKGFITLDGVSLTVVDVTEDSFTVTLVAYTQGEITLPEKEVGYGINIEVDILGKYVEKIMGQRAQQHENQPSGLSLDFLTQHGYQ